MRLCVRSVATGLVCLALTGCETKIAQISAVCRPAAQLTAPAQWTYTSKADPTMIRQIPWAIDITLHYPGTSPRTAPPVTTYFYRDEGATLRVVSSATATMPAKGTFTYHVDTGGYDQALQAVGRGRPGELAFFVVVDGSAFGGLLSAPTCGRWADGHLDIGKASKLPDLKDRKPLDMAQAAWLEVVPLPPAVLRKEATETLTYAFFKAPVSLTEAKDETSVPDGVAKQEAQIGVTTTTPVFTIIGASESDTTRTPQGGKT